MTLESICLEQQEIIERQNEMIKKMLEEIALHRALTHEEQKLLGKERGGG